VARRSAAARRLLEEEEQPRRRGRLRAVKPDDKPLYADADEVRDFAETLPERFLHCRELNHNWRPYTVGSHPDGGYERVLRCTRCRTRKIQSLTTSGALMGGVKYIHPPGYLHEGFGRIVGEGRDALRLESIKRIVSKGDE
jgi:hypothetical protein